LRVLGGEGGELPVPEGEGVFDWRGGSLTFVLGEGGDGSPVFAFGQPQLQAVLFELRDEARVGINLHSA
jgi:hypothetical protein